MYSGGTANVYLRLVVSVVEAGGSVDMLNAKLAWQHTRAH